jgi:predicted NAD/FAD-dependent oxidoreductase
MEPIYVETLIIGAGMSGLSCAKALADAGHGVLVVDKARGSGGRLASKSLTLQDGQQCVFDLGCAGISAQTPMFLQQIQAWRHAGLIVPWRTVEGVDEYVGTPRNSILTRSLADQVSARFSLRIEKLAFEAACWQAYVQDEGRLTPVIQARHVVLATPAEQAAALLPTWHHFQAPVARVATMPQWVVCLVVNDSLAVPEQPALLNDSTILHSIICESQKPGRQQLPGKQVWQIQLDPDWSAQHRDATPEQIYVKVVEELERLTGNAADVSDHYVHRWLYASGHHQLIHGVDCFWDGASQIGVCGDYFHHPELAAHGFRRTGVESAFLSGRALAARMGNNLHPLGKQE